MKKFKKTHQLFKDKYCNFLNKIGVESYGCRGLYYAFRVKVCDSEALEDYEKTRFKIAEFNVPFKNTTVGSLHSECLVHFNQQKGYIFVYPLNEAEEFKQEAFLEINSDAKLTKTRTFEDLFDYIRNNRLFDLHIFITKNYALNFDMVITHADFENNILRFSLYVPDNEIFETFQTKSFFFDKKFPGRLITLFVANLDRHFFTQIIDRYDLISVADIYKGVYEKQLEKDLPLITLEKPEKLKPDLKSYQISAVQWMLHRELDTEPKEHQILFEKFVFPDKQSMFIHKVFGVIITATAFQSYLDTFPRPKGGILADEMGLGKTVETIALILQNPLNKGISYPYTEPESIFDNRKNISVADIVCLCGNNQTGIIDTTPEDVILKNAIEFGFHQFTHPSFGFIIKCLHCGNYQHLRCQSFEKHKGKFPYVCNRCWLRIKKIKSPATLIVCPKSILNQWSEELGKHAPEVKVLIFQGIRKTIEVGTSEVIYPPLLAQNDIVLTTYDVLAREIDFLSRFDASKLRHHKRFLAPSTPLLSIDWHRLCLDEAQMVGFSKAFEMAQSIDSSYRWAISGTPIERCASEMKNLFAFICEEPFSHQNLTERVISLDSKSSDERKDFFFEAISNCLWRTPKNMVIDEIGLKPPIVTVEKLQMSQFERDFYQQTLGVIRKTNRTTEYFIEKRLDVSSYLNEFMRLRKICCCPSAVRNVWISSKSDHEQLSVEERMVKLLKSMISNTKKNAVCSLRSWISSMNCSSALYIQHQRYDEAVVNYRKTLKFIHEVEQDFKADSIQLFHIYYNYARILTLYGCEQVSQTGESLSNSLETFVHDEVSLPTDFLFQADDQFCAMKAMKFSEKYLLESQQTLFKVFEEVCKSSDPCKIEEQSKTKLQWYTAALKICERSEVSFFQAILPDYASNNQINQYGNSNLLIAQANRIVKNLKDVHQEIMDMFDIFFEHDLQGTDFYRYYNCHILKLKDTEECILCSISKKINTLRSSMGIFDFVSWKGSTVFSMLYKLSIFWKNDSSTLEDYDFIFHESIIFFDYIKALNTDFRFFGSLVTSYIEVINRLDELRQAKSLFRAESDSEYSLKLSESFLEQAQALEQFGHERHHVCYLKNLLENINEESVICCICLDNFEEFVILPCGHFNCDGCFKQLCNKQQTITCCICRTKTTVSKVHHAKKKEIRESVHTVTGQSTKFKHITIRIKEIIRSKEKVLVFSTWPDILEELQTCLEENYIISRFVKSMVLFGERLEVFRKSDACNVLLLPFNLAAKGLNLVEANHIVFVDIPIQSAAELQAIGRIHRIGQTKQTYVHKFIMANTIEELLKERIPNTEESTKHDFDTNEFILGLADSFIGI